MSLCKPLNRTVGNQSVFISGSLYRQNTEDESQWVEDHIWFHQSRVRDVEWITGLDFYSGSGRPVSELLKMKTRPTAAIQRKQ